MLKSYVNAYKAITYIPYAVPNWYSGTTKATIGHKALANIEYEKPMVTYTKHLQVVSQTIKPHGAY